MLSQFFGLNIAASGLRAANAALNTTGNNISNVDTDGYSRQKVNTQASDALRTFTRYGSAGAGVDTLSIERIRDEFYDVKYRNNNTLYGEALTTNYYNDIIERYYDDTGKNNGFSTLFSNMQASIQSVLTAAGESNTKANFVSNMRSITEFFNETAGNLQAAQNDVNQEIKQLTDRISSIGSEIATLNEQINTVGLTGSSANELKDKRDYLVDELSQIVSVETEETPIMDEYDPSRETGATRYQIWISGGQMLVDTYEYNKLVCVAKKAEDKTNQSDLTGLFDVKWVSSKYKEGSTDYIGNFQLSNKNLGGKLEGLVKMRDGNNNEFFHGTSASIEGAGTAGDPCKVTVSVDADYLKDLNKCNLNPTGVINIASKEYKYTDWDINEDGTYTFTLNPISTRHNVPPVDKNVKIGDAIDYMGIPYYQAQMNEWIRSFSGAVNKIMVNGYTSASGEGSYLLTGKADSISQYEYKDLTTDSDRKGYYNVTAMNFDVVDNIQDDPGLLATKADKTEGVEECHNLENLYEMISKQKIFRGATSGEFLDKVMADVALNKKNTQTMEATYKSLEVTIDKQRQSEMGVDSDEEASALVKYQNMYTLSSKMIQTLTEVYDRLILQTGV